jgi:ABC-type Fe3+/spermidine/putrescine transport system ATPase subunit
MTELSRRSRVALLATIVCAAGCATWKSTGRGAASPDPAALAAGPADLMIRPESVHVDRARPTGDLAALAGRVVGVSFLGAYTRVTVETPAGRVVAAPPNVEGSRSRALDELLDQEVCVWWNPADAVVTRQG